MIEFFYGKKKVVPEAYTRYVICKEFGWDYYTYESQPAWFIDQVLIVMNQENQFQKQSEVVKKRVNNGP